MVVQRVKETSKTVKSKIFQSFFYIMIERFDSRFALPSLFCVDHRLRVNLTTQFFYTVNLKLI